MLLNIIKCALFALMTSLLFLSTAVADTVWLKNGDKISGDILSLNDGEMEIQTSYAGNIKIKWLSISTMESDRSVSIKNSKTKEQYPTRITASTPGYVWVKTGEIDQKISITSIDEFMHTSVKTNEWAWTGNIDAGVNLKNASTHTDDYNFALNTKLRKEKWRHDIGATYDREIEDSDVNTDNYSFRYAIDYMFEEQYFWQARLSYKRDWVEDLSRQLLIGTGPGYQLWDDETGAFSLSMLGGAFSYGYSDNKRDSHLGASLRWDYQRFLISKTLTAYSNGELGHSLDNDGVVSLDAELGLRYALTSWSTFHIGYHRNIVKGTRDTLDERIFSTGLGMTWK